VDSEEEYTAAFPAAHAAALLRGLLLTKTSFGISMRGPLVYNENDVLTLQGSETQEDVLSVEICSFEAANGAEYTLHAPIDPNVFLAAKGDKEGLWVTSLDMVEELSDPDLERVVEELRAKMEETARDM
jgi:hypothetical protein